MSKIAVIAAGGRQYVVKEGDVLDIERTDGPEGSSINFEALMLADDKGANLEIGKPKLSATVKAKVLKQYRDVKMTIIKFKAKVRYRRHQGHRQMKTRVVIEKI